MKKLKLKVLCLSYLIAIYFMSLTCSLSFGVIATLAFGSAYDSPSGVTASTAVTDET